jgi:CubicO group peptidase (beta-lactamase class C family)
VTSFGARGALPTAALEPAFAAIAQQLASTGASAAVWAVADTRGIVRAQAFGRRGDRVTPETRFMIASITKPMLGAAVMQLVDEGRLDVYRPVHDLLPGFHPPPAAPGEPGGEAITPWHILTHTSGIPELGAAEMLHDRPSAERILERACTRRLEFAPGTRYAYVSVSFYVLAELLHRLEGRPYAEVLGRRVFDPLGMAETGFAVPPQPRARVHDFGPPAPLNAIYLRLFARREMPGGGLWSSLSDVVRFGPAFLADAPSPLLGGPAMALMTSEQTHGIPEGDPPLEPYYALAWNKSGLRPERPGGPGVIDHGAATGSCLWVDRDHGFLICFLMNRWTAGRTWSLPAVRTIYDALGLPTGASDATAAGTR